MADVRGGTLHGGLPFLAAGQGPPLLVFPGLGADNASPTGPARRLRMWPYRALAERFAVYVVNRRAGLRPGSTIGDLADDYAGAIGHEFAERMPVPIVGISTGGSIAQRLAIDHPEHSHWYNPVIVPPLAAGESYTLEWLGDAGRFSLGASYTEFLAGGRRRSWFTYTRHDECAVYGANRLPRWAMPEYLLPQLRRHWEPDLPIAQPDAQIAPGQRRSSLDNGT